MKQTEWDRRIRRANDLVSAYPFAAEGLRFYSTLASFQRSLYTDVHHALADPSRNSSTGSLQGPCDFFLLLPKFSGFLALIQQIAPTPLTQAAAALAGRGSAGWQRAIEDFWQGGFESPEAGTEEEGQPGDPAETTTTERLLAWIFVQPYAEYLADQSGQLAVDGTPSTCPRCGSKPIVGVLRREGDGAKKSLVCMLCAHEWVFRRIYCPSCGEEREPQMAYYAAPEIAHVRVDVCDTCHTYLKTIDLTKMGLAVPVVDELATIPLDLWAREHGYHKLQINLLGT
ncbi:MAG TPA: formate dehydrogenase accessory protein FdhE [Verrucomicrobiae bacterium]|nr:formate dehydrogenase accessory protein FdhE [Verrucomicrobiae bacterium]